MKTSAPIIFGEVLFDRFPDGRSVPGGAPFNVAWNLQGFDLSSFFISRIGADPLGEKIAKMMATWSMDTAGLQVDPHLPTGEVSITLNEGEPRFTILPTQAYDRIAFTLPGDVDSAPFLYHGSLALRDNQGRKTLARIKEQVSCPVFIDVNLRDPWWNRELVLSLLEEATWLKLNEQELHALFPARGSAEKCGRMVLERFNLGAVFITMGSQGALAITADEGDFAVAPKQTAPVADTVGAGDAFASVLLLGLVRGWPWPTIMDRAQAFASAVVGRHGAISTERQFYADFREAWR